jgi:hypothetical protein
VSSHFLAAKSSCLNVGGKQVVTQPRNKTKKNHFLEQKKQVIVYAVMHAISPRKPYLNRGCYTRQIEICGKNV